LDVNGKVEEESVHKREELINNIIEGYDGYIIEIESFYFDKKINIEIAHSLMSTTNRLLLQIDENEELFVSNYEKPTSKLKILKYYKCN